MQTLKRATLDVSATYDRCQHEKIQIHQPVPAERPPRYPKIQGRALEQNVDLLGSSSMLRWVKLNVHMYMCSAGSAILIYLLDRSAV